MKFKINNLLLAFLLVGSLYNCQNEDMESDSQNTDGLIKISLDVPSTPLPSGRSLSFAQDKVVNELDVFVFKGTTSSNATYIWKTHIDGDAIETDANGKLSINFSSNKLSNSDGKKCYFIILANSQTLINGLALTEGITTMETARTMMAKDLSSITTAVSSIAESSATYLPMAALYTTGVSVSGTAVTTVSSKIALIRSMSKVDISNSTNGTLNRVYVYGQSEGYLAPLDASAISGGTSVTVAVKPATSVRKELAVVESVSNVVTNRIFIPEDDMTGDKSCLVLEFTPSGAISPKYYRLEFKKTNNDALPLLRNHLYRITINKIVSTGYDTKEDALTGVAVDAVIEVSNEYNNTVFDSQFAIKLETNEIALPGEQLKKTGSTIEAESEVTSSFYFSKTYPYADTKITKGDNSDWFTITHKDVNTIVPGEKASITITTTRNTSIYPRIGTIIISAGELTETVTVHQSSLPINSYMVKPGETVKFKVDAVYNVWRDFPSLGQTLSGTVGVNLKWQSAKSLIRNFSISGSGKDAVITVVTGSPTSQTYGEGTTGGGNALIEFTVGGVVRWSYHIWVTDYDPEVYPIYYSGNIWMDRNMGAEMNYYDAAAYCVGMYYQWGRKDPFMMPSSAGKWGETTSHIYTGGAQYSYNLRHAYDYNGNEVKAWYEYSYKKKTRNFADIITDPMGWVGTGFATETGTGFYGYNTLKDRSVILSLWKDATTGGKTIFDPCPTGWMVARDRGTRRVFQTGISLPTANKGYQHPILGYFPAARIKLAQESGLLPTSYSEGVNYWTANPTQETSGPFYAEHLCFDPSSGLAILRSWSMDRDGLSYGSPLRCVKE